MARADVAVRPFSETDDDDESSQAGKAARQDAASRTRAGEARVVRRDGMMGS
jgi:hypothetical protein